MAFQDAFLKEKRHWVVSLWAHVKVYLRKA